MNLRTQPAELLCLFFAGSLYAQAPARSPAPTFTKDVAVILQTRCQGCHRPGEAAPFSLRTYEQARPWAKAIKEAVLARKMPPWFADPHYGKFSNDRSLPQQELETLAGWADAGAPRGNPNDMPPAREFADGWAIAGLAIIQSGQPYSVVDYSGAVGSIFYGTSDGITNPIVPLGSCTPSKALTGASGATPGAPALNAACFTLPLLNPGDLGGAIPAGDTYETNFTTGQRNIFRQAWQKRTDISLVKTTQITERAALKFSFDVFNLTNTASFDIPIDNVSQNLFFNDFPVYGSSLYSSPTASGLGIVNKTIGSPRQIQMSLKLSF